MVTGYDHLLFLTGVIFSPYRLKDVLRTLRFSLGHSTTLILGVLFDFGVSAHLVDMIIGLSVSYKAFDNLGGFRKLGSNSTTASPSAASACSTASACATKLQELGLSKDGLLPNLISFNIGVEIGQLIALSLILVVMTFWRTTKSFGRYAISPTPSSSSPASCWRANNCAGYFLAGDA